MKKFRKYLLGGISVFLLLCFSAILLPSDLFHEHNSSPKQSICASEGGQKCQHKMHLSTKNSFCWVCAVHFDKNFTAAGVFTLNHKLPIFQKQLVAQSLRTYQSEIVQQTLRGPPSA
jgi:hypothetical protein